MQTAVKYTPCISLHICWYVHFGISLLPHFHNLFVRLPGMWARDSWSAFQLTVARVGPDYAIHLLSCLPPCAEKVVVLASHLHYNVRGSLKLPVVIRAANQYQLVAQCLVVVLSHLQKETTSDHVLNFFFELLWKWPKPFRSRDISKFFFSCWLASGYICGLVGDVVNCHPFPEPRPAHYDLARTWLKRLRVCACVTGRKGLPPLPQPTPYGCERRSVTACLPTAASLPVTTTSHGQRGVGVCVWRHNILIPRINDWWGGSDKRS